MADAKKTIIAHLKKIRDNQDGTEDWMAETPFDTINYGFIKAIEQSKKGLKFDAVKILDGKLVLYFVHKHWKYAH